MLPLAKFIVPDWGDIVDSVKACIGLVAWRAGNKNPMPELTLFPLSETYEFGYWFRVQQFSERSYRIATDFSAWGMESEPEFLNF